MSLTVLAMGGHALLDPSLPPTVDVQFLTTAHAVRPITELVERGERLVITHGNGPQVGFMQLRSELARGQLHEVPLDSLVADSQGGLGFMIQRALRHELSARGLDTPIATIVTEVEVDAEDSAFTEPTKPIGSFYTAEVAERRKAEFGWQMVEDAGRGWRRVVPSPGPVAIVQLDVIRLLLDAGVIVIACGGGGIPVSRSDSERLQGYEAVIDKDRTSALLAVDLGADRLVITTATDAVYRDYHTDHARRLERTTVAELAAMQAEGQFPPGSMGPKIEAAMYFLDRGGASVTICEPHDLPAAFDGEAGTTILKEEA